MYTEGGDTPQFKVKGIPFRETISKLMAYIRAMSGMMADKGPAPILLSTTYLGKAGCTFWTLIKFKLNDFISVCF